MDDTPLKTRLTPELAAATKDLLTEWGVAEQIDLYLSVALPSIFYCSPTSHHDFSESLSTTFLGGVPVAPADFAWPCYNGKRIPFIAQIDLRQVPTGFSNSLPSTGILYFFCWCTNEVFPNPTSVIWLDGDLTNLVSLHAAPSEILPDWQGERLYEVEQCQSVVLGATVSRGQLEEEAIRSELYTDDELDFCGENVLGDVPGEYDGDIVSLAQDKPCPMGSDWGQSFGFAWEDFLLGMESCSEGYHEDGEVWVNLLQIASIGNMLWSDCGYLIFLIRQSDLKELRFDRVRVEIMSS